MSSPEGMKTVLFLDDFGLSSLVKSALQIWRAVTRCSFRLSAPRTGWSMSKKMLTNLTCREDMVR